MSQYSSNDSFDRPQEPAKGMAITSLVLGILGVIPPIGLVGVVLGVVALNRAKSQPERYGGRGLAIGGIVAGGVTTLMVCVFGGLIAILLPALGQSRQAVRHAVVQSNLRTVGVGITMYAADNKDYLPNGDWKAALVPAYLPATFLRGVGPPSGGDSIVLVPDVVRVSDAMFPAQVIVAYENNPQPWQGRIAVLFLDGHVADVSAADLPALLAANAEKAAAPPAAAPGARPKKPAPPGG